jgi:hypothetical protein
MDYAAGQRAAMTWRRALNITGWIVGFLALALFWQHLWGMQRDIASLLSTLDRTYLLLSLLVYFAGQWLFSLIPFVSHKVLGYPITMREAYESWFTSQLAKYLPGGLWIVPARTVIYTRRGIALIVASTMVTWEILAVLAAGLVIGLFYFTSTTGLWTGLAVLIAILLLSQLEWPWKRLARLEIPPAQRMLMFLEQAGSRRFGVIIVLTLTGSAIWLCIGTGFHLLLLALGKGSVPSWFSAVQIYAGAWAVGFLIFIAPAGLGAREATLTVLLTPLWDAPTAFAVAVLARIWWTVAESVHILCASALYNSSAARRDRSL